MLRAQRGGFLWVEENPTWQHAVSGTDDMVTECLMDGLAERVYDIGRLRDEFRYVFGETGYDALMCEAGDPPPCAGRDTPPSARDRPIPTP